MPNELKEGSTGVSIDHFLAGLAVWAVLMVVYAVL
jgi:hypothetical protein